MNRLSQYICLVLLFVIGVHIDVAQADAPLWARMLSPKYRNALYPTMGQPETIKIRTQLDVNPDDLANTSLAVRLYRDGTTLKTWTFTTLAPSQVLELKVAELNFEYTRSGPYVVDDNPYYFSLDLKSNNTILDTETLPLHNYPPPPAGVNEVRIDDDDNIVINGLPTFIYGVYPGSFNSNPDIKESISYLESLEFMAFLEYGDYLNGYHSTSSLGCVVATDGVATDNVTRTLDEIKKFREHPQVLAYLLSDEPNTHTYRGDPVVLQNHYAAAKDEDPYHIIYTTMTIKATHKIYSITEYTACQDIILLDPYPCRTDRWIKDLRRVYENYDILHNPDLGYSAFEHLDIPAAGIPQMHDYDPWRMPFVQEEKNIVYQHFVGGAKWIMPYSFSSFKDEYRDEWDNYGSTIIPEIKSIERGILAPRVLNSINITSSNNERLIWRHTQTEDKDYIFLVNTSSKWNEDMDFVPFKTDEVITIEITFKEPGGSIVRAAVRDANQPASYTLLENKVTLQLDGVNENSTGVLVIERDRFASNDQIPPAKPTGLTLKYLP